MPSIVSAYIYLIALAFCLFLLSKASARTIEYRPGSKAGIEFVVPYGPFGWLTHEGKAELTRASLFIDSENLSSTTGEFSVALSGMTLGNPEKDCHMREALGLNYAQSDFPGKHVCTENFDLPKAGKNAVVFPEILFKILSVRNITQSDQEATFEVEGQWTIHGVSKKQLLAIKLSPDKEKIRVSTTTKFHLQDFKMKVKPAKIFFFPLEVKDPVSVEIDLWLDAYPGL